MALQGHGLIVWREADREAVRDSSVARFDLAWAPDGLFVAHQTGPMEGRVQILRYQWGDPKARVLVDEDRLDGYPRSLTWDGNRLLFHDNGGLKAVPADGSTILSVAGPGLKDTVQGTAFDAAGRRYITLLRERLVVSEPGGTPLLEGHHPALYSDRILWINANGELMERRLPDGNVRSLGPQVQSLSPDPSGGRLFLFPSGSPQSDLLFLPIR